MSDDVDLITNSSQVVVMYSPESCVSVHDSSPSPSQEEHKVSSSWDYSSQVDLFPSLRNKSVTPPHIADNDRQLVVY